MGDLIVSDEKVGSVAQLWGNAIVLVSFGLCFNTPNWPVATRWTSAKQPEFCMSICESSIAMGSCIVYLHWCVCS